MTASEMNEEYFQWLLKFVRTERHPYHERLLRLLYDREFYWLLDRDSDRYENGLALQLEFEREFNLYFYRNNSPRTCSMLEMLIGLARDISGRIDYKPGRDRTDYWFWLMLGNLGLRTCTDRNFDSNFVNYVLDILLDRKYCKDGTGGLFKVKSDKIDMRKEEIWYQANYYISENFEF